MELGWLEQANSITQFLLILLETWSIIKKQKTTFENLEKKRGTTILGQRGTNSAYHFLWHNKEKELTQHEQW